MRKILCCLLMLGAIVGGLSVAESDAGPFANMRARMQERRAERQAARAAGYGLFGSVGFNSCAGSAVCGDATNGACMGDECDDVAAAAFMQAGNDAPTVDADKFGSGGDPRIDPGPTPEQQAEFERRWRLENPPGGFRGDSVDLSKQAGLSLRDRARLEQRERGMNLIQRFVWQRVQKRPDLQAKVVAYGKARGYAVDPSNLLQILDVLLAFFEKLLPLLLQLIGQTPHDSLPVVVMSYDYNAPSTGPPFTLAA